MTGGPRSGGADRNSGNRKIMAAILAQENGSRAAEDQLAQEGLLKCLEALKLFHPLDSGAFLRL